MLRFFTNPSIAHADIGQLMSKINKVILNPIIIFMFAVALIIFLYGLVQFLANPANEETRDTGKRHILWGIVGMTIMVSVFGIMQLIVNSFGFTAPGGGAIDFQKQ